MNFNLFSWFLLVNVGYIVISAEKRKQSWTANDGKKSSFKEEGLTGYDYKDLISKLKDNWQFPGTYLEKRGYSQDMNTPHESAVESGGENIERFKHETPMEAEDEERKVLSGHFKPKKFFYFPVQHVAKKQSDINRVGGEMDPSRNSIRTTTTPPSAKHSEQTQVVVTKQAVQSTTSKDMTTTKSPDSTTEKPMGFFQKLKTKISNIFRKDNSSSLSDDYPLETDYVTSFEEPPKARRSVATLLGLQKRFGSSETCSRHVSMDGQKTRDSRSILDTLQALTAQSSNADKVLSENSDIFKNLTKAEMDYIRTFLEFFRENKEKFLLIYMNKTANTNKTCESQQETTEMSVNKSSEGDSLQVNIEINTLNSTNVKEGNCIDLNKFLNKLKFLAHLHHSVYEVGKTKNKHVDLKLIQEMIDSTRSNLGTIAILGIGGDGQNQTNCSPLEINEVSPVFGKEYEDGANEVISKYLSDTMDQSKSQLLKPSYGENFLDYPAEKMAPSTVDKVHAKRQALLGPTDQFDEKIDKAVSDVVSSLDKLEDDDTLVGSESFFDDYDDQFGSIQKRKSKKKKKKKKKKKNKKKKPKYSKSTAKVEGGDLKGSSQNDILEINDLLGSNTGKLDMDPNSNMMQLPHSFRDDETFSELNDIKFRLNQDQEEAIEKFIRSLNTPPEIFSFDVDKFIKLNSPIHEQILMEPPSTKTYYEFLDPSSLDGNKANLQNEPSELKPQNENAQNKNGSQQKYTKRDILKEYIKGVSDHLREVSRNANAQSQNGAAEKTDSPEKDMADDGVVQSFANDLDTLNYNQFVDKSDGKNVDDFIENFYLLNDGTSGILKNEELAPRNPETTPKLADLANDLDPGKQFIKFRTGPKFSKTIDQDYMFKRFDSPKKGCATEQQHESDVKALPELFKGQI